MTTYAPNGVAAQPALSSALRSYTPNAFSGGAQPTTGAMAPHLSTPESERPFASDIALLRGSQYANRLPDLDKMWNYSPTTYQEQVSHMLRNPQTAGVLENLRNPPPKFGDTMQRGEDESGNPLTLAWDGENWSRPRRQSGD